MNIKKKKREVNAWPVTMGTLIIVLTAGFFAWLQLDVYEHSILDVYAAQQDSYVQLVIDQINLIDDKSDEAAVSNILATLDASSSKYWILTHKDAPVFVKDVHTTNRCKGLTTAAYFDSDSAKQFIAGLQINRVVHGTVELNGISYAASGAKFEYGSEEYGICLFTASDIILDHNAYLGAKINLCLLFVIILAAFVIGGLTLTIIARNRCNKLAESRDDNKRLREQVERLAELLTRQELYNSKYMAFCEPAVDMLIDKLEARDIWPLTYIIVKCSSEEERNRFLLDAQAFCDKKFIRAIAKNNYLLMFNIHSAEAATAIVRSTAVNSGARVVGSLVFPQKPDVPLRDAIKQYNSSVMAGDGSDVKSESEDSEYEQ